MSRRNKPQENRGISTNEYLVALLVMYRKAVNELPDARLLSDIQKQLAGEIISATEKAERIEELIELEMLYQELDGYFALSKTDVNSIDKARVGYLQIAGTIGQMRRAPAEYIASNIAAYETQRNPRKIDRTKALKQIWANKTRLQNRASFASSEWHDIWKARISLADKTEKMYRALHAKLVDDYERDITP